MLRKLLALTLLVTAVAWAGPSSTTILSTPTAPTVATGSSSATAPSGQTGQTGTTGQTGKPVPTIPASSAPVTAVSPAYGPEKKAEVIFGIDVLAEQDFALLKGKQVGLITNQTGVNVNGRSTADVLFHAPGVKVIALFSPEHGIRGTREHGQVVGDTFDSRTRLPVYSLYGTSQRPTSEMLNAVEVLVFDIQDVGARFYTYVTTMGLCMEAAAQRHIPFVVLDRPNPVGGEVVEGQVLDWRIRHFTAYYSIPVRHGLTIGELAQWYNKTANLKVDLTVVPVKGWKRSLLWEETGRKFVPPSPNIRTPRQALAYSGIGMFEATNLAVGRGTDTPFELIGAPWMKAGEVAARLEALHLAGVTFSSTTFTPTKDLYANKLCQGLRIDITDPHAARPVDWFVYVSCFLRELSPKEFQPRWDEIARVTGSRDFQSMYQGKKSAFSILDVFRKSADKFREARKPFLLYGD